VAPENPDVSKSYHQLLVVAVSDHFADCNRGKSFMKMIGKWWEVPRCYNIKRYELNS
jgi:hypothetical protein